MDPNLHIDPNLQMFVNLGGFIGVLAYIIIRDWIDGKFKKKEDQPLQKMQGDMDHLRIHFNDDLTTILTAMQVEQKEILDTLRDFQRNGIRIRRN